MPRSTRLRPEEALLALGNVPRRNGRLRHVGLRSERQVGDFSQARRERAFAERWARENDREHGQTHFLDMILSGLDDARSPMQVEGAHGHVPRPAVLSQRDATLAATLMQWLGTNVGFCFVEESLRDAGYVIETRECIEQWRESRAHEAELVQENQRLRSRVDPAAGRELTPRTVREVYLVTPETDSGDRVTVRPGEPGHRTIREVLLPGGTSPDAAVNTTTGTLRAAAEQEASEVRLEAQVADTRAAAAEIARAEVEAVRAAGGTFAVGTPIGEAAAFAAGSAPSIRVRPGEPGYAALTEGYHSSHATGDIITSPERLQAAIRRERDAAEAVERVAAERVRLRDEANGIRPVPLPDPHDPSPVEAGAGTTRANLSQARRMRPTPPLRPPAGEVGPGPGDADDDDPFGEGEVAAPSGAPSCPNCGSYAVVRVSPNAEEYHCTNCECTDVPTVRRDPAGDWLR